MPPLVSGRERVGGGGGDVSGMSQQCYTNKPSSSLWEAKGSGH